MAKVETNTIDTSLFTDEDYAALFNRKVENSGVRSIEVQRARERLFSALDVEIEKQDAVTRNSAAWGHRHPKAPLSKTASGIIARFRKELHL